MQCAPAGLVREPDGQAMAVPHDGRFRRDIRLLARSVPFATVHNIRIGRHLSAHGMPDGPCAVSSLCPLGGVQKNMRSNMRAYLAVILSAMTVATLLASPASARHFHHRYSYYGSYGYGSYGYVGRYGPYTPSLPTRRYGPSLDFQGGSRY